MWNKIKSIWTKLKKEHNKPVQYEPKRNIEDDNDMTIPTVIGFGLMFGGEDGDR